MIFLKGIISLIKWFLYWLFRFGAAVAPILTAKIGVGIFTRPSKSKDSLEDLKIKREARRSFLNFENGQLAMMEWGEGPIILGVHGWNSSGKRFSNFVKPISDSGFRLLVFDGPAHGCSSGSHLDLMQYARSIVSVAREMGTIHALIAHSFGSIASLLAVEKGLKVEKMVIFSPLNGIKGTIDYLTRNSRMPAWFAHRVQDVFEKRFQRDLNSVEALSLASKLDLPPSLIFHDADDPILPVQNARDLSCAWKNSQLLVTRGLGHQGCLDDDQVIRKVVSFVASLEESRLA